MPPGIRRHGAGWQVEVRVVGHPRIVEPFPLDTPIETMVAHRRKIKRALQASRPERGTAGSFARDAERYLKARAAMPEIEARRKLIALWVQEFGPRARVTIKPWEIRAVRDRWLTVGPKFRVAPGGTRAQPRMVQVMLTDPVTGAQRPAPLSASQVNNRLRALENLWTVLDGRHAYNPVREVPEAEEPEAEARALPYDVVEAILAQMPDTRHRVTVTAAHIAAVQAAPASTSARTLARQLGLSDQIIGRIRRGILRAPSTRTELGLTKLRLRAIAYTGFAHAELQGIAATDLHLDETPPWVWVRGRAKGAGTKGHAQPLTAEGAAALRALAAAGGLGAFSESSMRTVFVRACRKLDLTGIRPYDLRHSFASEVFEKTGDLRLTRLLMRHEDDDTTARYGKRAIPAVLAAAITKLRADGGFGAGALLARSASDFVKTNGSFSHLSPDASVPSAEGKSAEKP